MKSYTIVGAGEKFTGSLLPLHLMILKLLWSAMPAVGGEEGLARHEVGEKEDKPEPTSVFNILFFITAILENTMWYLVVVC